MPGGLRSARRFSDTLELNGVDSRVTRLVNEAPAPRGPLNPHMLAIRSLAAMRDISPRYLPRFVAYVDTLFWLERAEATNRS